MKFVPQRDIAEISSAACFLLLLVSFFSNLSLAAIPKIDPAFSPEEQAIIQSAVASIPACHRPKLENLRFIQSMRLIGPADDCDEGFYPGDGSILLYSKCKFNVGSVVHEIFHHLGRFNGLNEKWKAEVQKRIPACPISEYAEDGLGQNNEDLAETGRILLVPGSGQRNSGECVERKIQELRKILAGSC